MANTTNNLESLMVLEVDDLARIEGGIGLLGGILIGGLLAAGVAVGAAAAGYYLG